MRCTYVEVLRICRNLKKGILDASYKYTHCKNYINIWLSRLCVCMFSHHLAMNNCQEHTNMCRYSQTMWGIEVSFYFFTLETECVCGVCRVSPERLCCDMQEVDKS